MLSKKDIAILRVMFRENNEVLRGEIKREMRDEIHSVVNAAVAASERRMIERMDRMEERILDGVTDLIDRQIVPQISALDTRVTRIERVLKLA